MNIMSRQAAVGALVAAALVLGANAGTSPHVPLNEPLTFIAQKDMTALLRSDIAAITARILDAARAAAGAIALPEANGRG